MRDAGGDIIRLDWRVRSTAGGRRSARSTAFRAISTRRPSDRTHVAEAARDVLRRAGGRPGHIFNLGHGGCHRRIPTCLPS